MSSKPLMMGKLERIIARSVLLSIDNMDLRAESKELKARLKAVRALRRQVYGDDQTFFVWCDELDAALEETK